MRPQADIPATASARRTDSALGAIGVGYAVGERRAACSWAAEASAGRGLKAEAVYAAVVEASALRSVAGCGGADAVLADAGDTLRVVSICVLDRYS